MRAVVKRSVKRATTLPPSGINIGLGSKKIFGPLVGGFLSLPGLDFTILEKGGVPRLTPKISNV